MEELIKDFLAHVDELPQWGIYAFLFLSALLQITFPPYPGDSVLVFGGTLGSTGLLGGNIPILLSYLAGTLISSYALYELGVWKGEVLLHSKFASRYFPYASQEKARKWVLKYGIAAFFLSKFIPGLNSLIIVFGGIFKYDKTWAYIGIGAASTLHNIAFFMAGRFVGGHWEKIGAFLASYNRIVITAALAGLALYFCFWLWKRKRKKAIRDSEE